MQFILQNLQLYDRSDKVCLHSSLLPLVLFLLFQSTFHCQQSVQFKGPLAFNILSFSTLWKAYLYKTLLSFWKNPSISFLKESKLHLLHPVLLVFKPVRSFHSVNDLILLTFLLSFSVSRPPPHPTPLPAHLPSHVSLSSPTNHIQKSPPPLTTTSLLGFPTW